MPRTHLPPTPAQLAYLDKLSRSRGVRFSRPTTRAAASRQIAALKAMGAGRLERRIERDLGAGVAPGGALAAVRDDELDGYGARATWRRTTLDD